MLTILFLIGMWFVIKATARVVMQYKHLTDQDIKDVMTNRMDKYGKKYSRITRHLGLCKNCQNRLHHFNEDDFLEDHLIDED